MAKIKEIIAREILDSQGYPTLAGELILDNNISISASVPSMGTNNNDEFKVKELVDGDKDYFGGRGVKKAIYVINNIISNKIKNVEISKHKELENWLIAADNTKDKEKLGANTVFLLSLLFARAAAKNSNLPLYQYLNFFYNDLYKENLTLSTLPAPIFNAIAGGTHANNKIDFKEFQVIPSSSLNYPEALLRGWEVIKEIEQILLYRNANISIGKEGSFAPNLSTNTDALEIINESILRKGLRLGIDVFIGVDLTAQTFFKDDRYFVKDYTHPLKKEDYLKFVEKLKQQYTLLFVEEPFAYDDTELWTTYTKDESVDSYIVADESISASRERLEKFVSNKMFNTLVIKPIRFGTITETFEVINFLRKNSLSYALSTCVEETNDSFIADLAYATQAEFVKFGGLMQGERIAKYNRLWTIAQQVEKASNS